MPASVYSVRFGQWSAIESDVSVTVPAGRVWILRDFDAVVRTAGAVFLVGAGGQLLFYDLTVSGDTRQPNRSWRGRQVYNAGESIGVGVGSGGEFDATISGYSLLAA